MIGEHLLGEQRFVLEDARVAVAGKTHEIHPRRARLLRGNTRYRGGDARGLIV